MAGNDAEERKEPPSSKRIADLRRRGKIPQSKDFTAGVSLGLMLFLLLISSREAYGKILDLFAAALSGKVFSDHRDLHEQTAAAFSVGAKLIVPTMALGLIVALFAHLMNARGFPISEDALKPNFAKLNPLEGFKKSFKLNNVFDMLKALIKLGCLVTVTVVILTHFASQIFYAPFCGSACVLTISTVVPLYMLVAGVSLAIIVGLIDLPISTALFKRDHRMTKSEVKRERKDSEGDPAIRRARRAQQDEARTYVSGIEKTSFVVQGAGGFVCIHFVPDVTEAPMIVAKIRSENREEIARVPVGTPVFRNDQLYAVLSTAGRVGSMVPPSTFDAVADIIVDHMM